MTPWTLSSTKTIRSIAATCLALILCSCGLFEPRTPENPSQSGQDTPPALDAPTVITNLTTAVIQKNYNNYIRCFADLATGPRSFTFLAASDGIAQYGSIFSIWTRDSELNYFHNLCTRITGPTAASNLVLSEKSPPNVSADSVVYYYDYQFNFEHNDPTFPKTARGSLIFTMAPDNTGQWSIFRWADFKSGSDITWSMFKGKFGS